MEQSSSGETKRSSVRQEIPRIFETQMFITALTIARHLSLPWARPIQSTTPTHFYKIHFNRWRPTFLCPYWGTCFTSSIWRLEFWGGSYVFGKFLHSWIKLYYTHIYNVASNSKASSCFWEKPSSGVSQTTIYYPLSFRGFHRNL
jgi:hypothetical protein